MSEILNQLTESLGSQYRLERELGGGGMSRVFLAEEVALGRKVVIKVLPPELAAELSRMVELAAGYGKVDIRGRLRLTLLESAPRILAHSPRRCPTRPPRSCAS